MTNTTKLKTAREVELAKLASQHLSTLLETSGKNARIYYTDTDDKNHEVVIPTTALEPMIKMLAELGKGNSVSVIPTQTELTTQEAADMLNMSRPTFIKLLESKEIPYSRSGNRRKVAYADLLHFKKLLERKRLEVISELSALDQEMDLGY